MAQPYPNPIEFGDLEAERLARYRARLLAQHGAEAPDSDEDSDRGRPIGPALIAAVVLAVPVSALLVLLVWG